MCDHASAARAWVRSEVFNGVLPLPATIPQPESPRKQDISPSRVIELLARLRQQPSPSDMTCYTTWITEAWACLQWSEPTAKLFWEMVYLFSDAAGDELDVGSKGRRMGSLPTPNLVLFLLLHTSGAVATTRGSPPRHGNFNEAFPSPQSVATSFGDRGNSAMVHQRSSPHSPTSLKSRALLMPKSPPHNTGGAGAGGPSSPTSPLGSPTSPRSSNTSLSLCLQAHANAEVRRLDFVRSHLDTILRIVATGDELKSEPGAAASTASPKPGADGELVDGSKDESKDELGAAFMAAALPRRRLTRSDLDRCAFA